MANRLDVKKDGAHCYDICITESLADFPEEFNKLGYQNRKICVVTDSHVAPYHGQDLINTLAPICKAAFLYVFEAGEEHKNLDTVKNLYAFLIENHFDRKDCLIALGGGVTGDLTGFAAATYLRGIDYIQMPTSLLAMADSSIGGKTGVDFDAYKNMVGAFKMPRLVYMNLAYLQTLPDSQYANGMAEIIKHGLIRDIDLYLFLLNNMFEILDRDMNIVGEMLLQSCKNKKAVVEEDPTEKGLRAILNFGHTLGHAIEKLSDFSMLHGQCVSAGMVCASYISYKRGYLTKEEFLEIRDVLVAFGLPVSIDEMNIDNIISMTKSDKKMDGNTIRFILLKSVGEACIDLQVTEEEMREALTETVLAPPQEDDGQIIKFSDILEACGPLEV